LSIQTNKCFSRFAFFNEKQENKISEINILKDNMRDSYKSLAWKLTKEWKQKDEKNQKRIKARN
jgi:hypothetical protein